MIVSYDIKRARRAGVKPRTIQWAKRRTHQRHRRAHRVYLRTGKPVRNMDRPLTARDLY